jgi:hypothetical protein
LLLLASTAGLCRRAIGVRAASVERLKGEGRYALVPGLYLQITASGARSWLLRFELNGKERQRGDLHARPNTASRQQTQSRQLAALG